MKLGTAVGENACKLNQPPSEYDNISHIGDLAMRPNLTGPKIHTESVAPDEESVTNANQDKRGSGQILLQNPKGQQAKEDDFQRARPKQTVESLPWLFAGRAEKYPIGLTGGAGKDGKHGNRLGEGLYTLAGRCARGPFSSQGNDPSRHKNSEPALFVRFETSTIQPRSRFQLLERAVLAGLNRNGLHVVLRTVTVANDSP